VSDVQFAQTGAPLPIPPDPSDGDVLEIPIAQIFEPLLAPRRWKGTRGGRGSAKSHFWAGKVIEDSLYGHLRVACVREYQSSIKDSVKALLEDKIRDFGLGELYRSTETEIVGPHESLIIFRGLNSPSTGRSGTAASLKSLEGFARCWVEEAQTISYRSLELLTPTFRAPGSELWFSWNPNKPTDPVDVFFRENEGDPDVICVTANYHDNPWFPADLRSDMERDKRRDPDRYSHIWLGQYERQSEARVFRNWRIEEFAPPPRNTQIHLGADWGFSVDPTVLIRCWLRDDRTLYIEEEAYAVGCAIEDTPRLFDTVNGARNWPIRADSARPETIDYMKRRGYKISPAVKGKNSVEEGVEFLRGLDIVVHPRCVHTIDELSRYSWKTDTLSGEILPVLEDANNHVIDALRYSLEGRRLIPQRVKITPEAMAMAKGFRTPRRIIVPAKRW
jgi:phage terminase large subunit